MEVTALRCPRVAGDLPSVVAAPASATNRLADEARLLIRLALGLSGVAEKAEDGISDRTRR